MHKLVQALKDTGCVDADGNITEIGLRVREQLKDFYTNPIKKESGKT